MKIHLITAFAFAFLFLTGASACEAFWPDGYSEAINQGEVSNFSDYAGTFATPALERQCEKFGQYRTYSGNKAKWYHAVRDELAKRNWVYVYTDEHCKITPLELYLLTASKQIAAPPLPKPTN